MSPSRHSRHRIERLRAQHGDLYVEIMAALYACDPMCINLGCNPAEYEPEVGTIVPRLVDAASAEDVARIVAEEFGHWFNGMQARDGAYAEAGARIWELWTYHLAVQHEHPGTMTDPETST